MARRDIGRDTAPSHDIQQPLLEDSVLQDADVLATQQGLTKLAWAVELGALLQLAAPVIIQLGSQYAVTLTNQAGLRLMPKPHLSSCLLLWTPGYHPEQSAWHAAALCWIAWRRASGSGSHWHHLVQPLILLPAG